MCKLTLLSINSKLSKSIKAYGDQILTAGLFLAPHKLSGRNVCPFSGHCAKACVMEFAGRQLTSPVRNAQLRRTKLYFDDSVEFRHLWRKDIERLLRKAERESFVEYNPAGDPEEYAKTVYIRNNGASDLDFSSWAGDFPEVEFYDYTKRPDFIRRKLSGEWPANYALTYSHSERADMGLLVDYLESGGNVSVVFDTEYNPQARKIGQLPDFVELTNHNKRRFQVIDGDQHDLRHPEFDGRGKIIGLRFKGSRKRLADAISAGMVISAERPIITADQIGVKIAA
jgi:hypothetical protein